MNRTTLLLFLIIIFSSTNIIFQSNCRDHNNNNNEDFYKLLAIPRDANVKEIRKAFKTLAVKLHPDKNKDDKDAAEKFVRIAKAYETLKDPDSRKQYDLHGEEGSSSNKNHQYHSYTYYRDQFGIYDDDPLIVTLSRVDYEVNVLDNNQAWFVNFYSPNCHHCHELAPDWRKLAADLEGVIRIAAVNCEDDWSLCHQLGIESYPTLLYYPKEANMHEGEKYLGSRNFHSLNDYVMSRLTGEIKPIDKKSWKRAGGGGLKQQTCLLFLCADDVSDGCPEHETRLKLATILEGLMPVGIVTDRALALQISESYPNHSIVLWSVSRVGKDDADDVDNGSDNFAVVHNIVGSDSKEILDNILNILPNPETIDQGKFQTIRSELRSGTDKPWLICFYLGPATDLNLQLKRLPSMLPQINIGLVHCGRSAALCSTLHVPRYPAWGTLKVGGAFELHHGRDVLHEVVTFALNSVKSTNLHALSPADFNHLISQGSMWFIDWYAPWCPPCKRLMPELRRASQHFNASKVQFGTVDCTLHRSLCAREGVTSYPTTMLYNGSQIHRFHGVPSEDGIVEFVSDMLTPIVISLDASTFAQRLAKKSKSEMWAVDFYAPWCGPCQRLAPEWRRLAKEMTQFDEIKLAQVDCVANSDLCSAQNIKSYPTIRLYPLGSKGLNSVAIYNGNRDMVSMKRWLLGFIPSTIRSLTSKEFKQQILTKKFTLPWLVEFYAPWCGHCTHFEPEFRTIAKQLDGKVRCAKIDCEAERLFCGDLYVTSYPTLLLYLSPSERHEIESHKVADILTHVNRIVERRKNRYGHDEL